MRLGEIKNIVNEVIDEANHLFIDHEPIFNGQAQLIKNFAEIMEALEVLSKQKWNDIDYSAIEDIRKEYNTKQNSATLTEEKFNKLNSYVSSINNKMPIFIGILDTMVEKQDTYSINLKLPSNINSLEDLKELSKRLDKLFKQFQVDGEFSFVGFDKGSEWLIFLVGGVLSHTFFIDCLKVAQEIFKTKTEYYKSKTAKMDYQASLKNVDDFSEEGLELYKEK